MLSITACAFNTHGSYFAYIILLKLQKMRWWCPYNTLFIRLRLNSRKSSASKYILSDER